MLKKASCSLRSPTVHMVLRIWLSLHSRLKLCSLDEKPTKYFSHFRRALALDAHRDCRAWRHNHILHARDFRSHIIAPTLLISPCASLMKGEAKSVIRSDNMGFNHNEDIIRQFST
jgi:hypothetical protein